MICHSCRTPDHSGCPGGSHCDCGHKGHPEAPPVLDSAERLAATTLTPATPPPVITINSNGDGHGQ